MENLFPCNMMQDTLPVQFTDIEQAVQVLEGVAHRTPVFTSRTLDVQTGARVFLKAESLQRTGSFKFRGAYFALSRLSPEERKRGVLTYSSGNHAQAIALAGQLQGTHVVVVMPEDAPSVKIKATRGYGAEVILYNRQQITREELGRQIAGERGLTIIPPYDHPSVVAGQGTVGWEINHQVPALDVLVVPVGGGGLLAGCALALHQLHPGVQVVGAEPAAADDAYRSFRTGVLHTVHNPNTIADGARTPSLGKITFPIIRKYVHEIIRVHEEAIVRAMFFLWQRTKLVVEPTGALALAGVLSHTSKFRGKKVGVVLSGGNVDFHRAVRLFEQLNESG